MKTFTIEGFQMLVADGDGMRETCVGYMSNKPEADRWAEQSKGWRSVRPTKQVIVVYDTLVEFEQGVVEAARLKALAKLSPEERVLLGFPKDL